MKRKKRILMMLLMALLIMAMPADMNIANMANQSKGEYAYSLFDLDTQVTDEVVDKLKNIQGVLKIRIL